MAPPKKSDTPAANVDATGNPVPVGLAPERLEGLKPGESSIKTEYPVTADGLEVKGPHNVVDTTPLGDNAPFGDARAGVLADQPVPGIDPASNLPIDQMDGRIPRPAADTRTSGQTGPDYKAPEAAGGVKVRLNTKYWPRERPKDLDEATEYVLHPGQEVSLPSEEAMDLLERGQAERLNKRS
jgi:hypothetical protein